MCSHENSRVLVLEEEVKNLSEELLQCQADKEFVWSLWKRLQVTNPDLTQAVSLVVEREKHKTEMKDRKVLEILQSKDYKIQDLEQRVTGQQQEINRLLQKETAVEEDGALMKELTTLREQLNNKNQHLEEMRTEQRKKEEEEQRVVHALEEENEGLRSRCAALSVDLQEERRQADSQRDKRDAAQARLKDLEKELQYARQELPKLQAHSAGLAEQLSSKERELAAKQKQLNQIRRDFTEVQTLYRQSTEHAAEQSHLIHQLEGLNLDTQRVLRNQEEAYTADTTSYQGLYRELSQCYHALVSSEAKLRQSHQELCTQMVQKEEQVSELQARLQKQQEQIQLLQHHTQHPALSPNKQTNFKAGASQSDRASTQGSDPRPEDRNFHQRSTSSVRRLQDAPVQRSRSLSPAGSVGLGSGRRIEAEQRIRHLEELLQLKTDENEELRKAHDKRCERLCLIQTNYKAIRDQMKEMEKSHGLSGGKIQRPEPRQLRQENSDAVWNELTYLKNLNRKLATEKAGLEEELDMLRVRSAMDRATVKELHMCLANDHQELLQKMAEEQQVKSSTPSKPCLSSSRLKQSFKKMKQLEQRMVSLEEQKKTWEEERELLFQANQDLVYNCRKLQASIDYLGKQECDREEEARARALAQDEQHRSEIAALEARLATSQREITKRNHQLLKLRQELGIMRAARDFYRNRAAAPARAAGTANNISGKVKLKTAWHRGLPRQRSHRTVSSNQAISWQGRSPSPTKDEWEDMSADSDSGEEFSDSLNKGSSGTEVHRQQTKRKSYRQSPIFNTEAPAGSKRKQDDKQQEPWERGTRGEKRRWRKKRMLMNTQHCSSSSLQQRIEALQHHIDFLQSARKDALLVARELRGANEAIKAQLSTLTEQLNGSKQLTQKLTSDLAGVEQQKKVLEMELEQWKKITFPPKSAPPPAAPPTAPVNTECFCQGKTMPALQSLEAEVKQLQVKLKSTSAEVTTQMAANKALRGQLQEKDVKLCQLQDKMSHTERDVAMKRQLVEDLKTRLKVLQEMEKSYRAQMEELEKKVKALLEEASNRKALIESLKRRLNVATTEKGQHEASCAKLKEDIEKKEQRIQALQARVGAGERALAALERTATEQMEGLTQQSSQSLDKLQRRLGQAGSQLEQLHCFVKTLASEILLDVQEVKQQLMSRRRQRQASSVAAKSSLSAKSMIKAKSIAASILNMSENDLADIMETDQRTAICTETHKDQEWLDHLNLILHQKIPSAGQLMEAVRVKMKERKVLTEELATLAAPVSEKP